MDVIFVILILLFGYSLKKNYKILNRFDYVLLNQLFVYHMIMSVIFFIYIKINGGDALGYWINAQTLDINALIQVIISGKATPSYFVYLICYIPANILNLSLFTGCLLFGTLGYWGIVFLFVTLKETFPLLNYIKHIKVYNFSIFPSILFLPNFHFWSSGIGKDTLLFFCVGAFFYAINNISKRWFLLLIVLIISYFIRPHILLFLLFGFATSYVIRSRFPIYQKAIIIFIAILLFLPLLNNVIKFAHIEDASVESYTQFGEKKAHALSGNAGSAIDIINLPYPLQVFTFLYRPLFFDTHNFLGFLASVENIIWILLSINFLRNKPITVFKNSHFIIFSAFLFWIVGALAFAPILGNLGIIIRERNMFLPGFIIFMVAGLYNTSNFKKFRAFYYFKHNRVKEL